MISQLVPELTLAITLVFILLCQISYLGESRRLVDWVALGGVFTAAIQALVLFGQSSSTGESALGFDHFAVVCRLTALFLGGAAILGDLGISFRSRSEVSDAIQRADEKLLVVFLVLALCVMAASQSFALTLAGVLGLMLGSAVLISKDHSRATTVDAAGSAYRMGLLALALFSGAALMAFYHTGSSLYSDVRRGLLSAGLSDWQWLSLSVPVVLTAAALMGLFPFHSLRLRFLSGTSPRLVGFIDAALRLGGVYFLFRIGFYVLSTATSAGEGGEIIWGALERSGWIRWLEVVVYLSLIALPILSFWDSHAQRRLAALASAAFAQSLLTWGMGTRLGISVSLYSIVIELLALMGASIALAGMTRASGSERLTDLGGSAFRRPFEALVFTLFLLTLVGLPPFPGFGAKVAVLSELLAGDRWGSSAILLLSMLLAYVSALTMALSLLGDSRESVAPKREWNIPIALYLSAPLVLLACFPKLLLAIGDQAMRLIFR